MRGSWVTTFAVGGVLLILTLFLGLQYNWLRQASDAERERMQKRVENDTRGFADDFNREMQAAYFNFQTPAASWEKSDWAEFNERYDYWKSKTHYPELVRGFVYFNKGDAAPLVYNFEKRVFEASPAEPYLLSLPLKIKTEGTLKSFRPDEYVFVMPVHRLEEKRMDKVILRRTPAGKPPTFELPEAAGHLVITLDRQVISERILPDLTAKHFGEGGFRVAVSGVAGEAVFEPAGAVGEPDSSAKLFSLAPDNMLFFSDRAMLPRSDGEKSSGLMVSERVESRTFTHTETHSDGTMSGGYTIELRPGDKTEGTRKRTSIIASTSGDGDPWTLSVQHTTGSIDKFIRGEFNKSFAIGLGVYLLLVGAIVAIVLSAMRSRRFARRQIDFVSSVSHEFRTPLAVIYSAGENLADGVANDRENVVRYGNLIKGEGRKLSAMVEQILQFAGASSGKKKYNFSPAAPAELAAAAVRECAPILDENGFEIETAADENLPAMNVDAEAVSTALQNLISNAVKYSNGRRRIRIAATRGGGSVKFTVQDHGIGIAGDDLKHIFEPFYRAKNVVDAQIHGNGLGLALVKEIAEAHGGKVTAKSEVGKGTEFTIELPNSKL